jgi:hypothetical protein
MRAPNCPILGIKRLEKTLKQWRQQDVRSHPARLTCGGGPRSHLGAAGALAESFENTTSSATSRPPGLSSAWPSSYRTSPVLGHKPGCGKSAAQTAGAKSGIAATFS